MSEHDIQSALIQWARMSMGRFPELQWLHSSLNGIFIPGPPALVGRIINHMKAEGMTKGIPDLFLPVARHGYHGLYIELKRDEKSGIKPEQIEFMAFAEAQGYLDKICFGFDDAKDVLEWYLGQ